MSTEPLILIVEDDRLTRDYLVELLVSAAYRVASVADGHAAVERSQAGDVDLVVLDRGLPGLDGLTVCEQLRARPGPQPPILMLTAFTDLNERLRGFAAGVDDYVAKPFRSAELLARIKTILRRTGPGAARRPALVDIDPRLQIDFEERQVVVDGQHVALSRTECELLRVLVQHAGQAVPIATILTAVWGPAYTDAPQYVHLYVTYLRRRIERDPRSPRYLQSERGAGYRFQVPAAAAPPTAPIEAAGAAHRA
jgi:DNA-binding response OmpR family regulator